MSQTQLKVNLAKLKLDRIDRQILRDLQENGRMTNVELAKNAGISAPPCLRRVRHLEEQGLIRSYHAVIDPAAMGYPVTVMAMVKLNNVGEGDLKKFEQKLESWDMVREAHMMTGEFDFLLKIVAKDWDDYQQFLTNELVNAAGVSTVKSSLSVKLAKSKAGVPIQV
jgi:DNA-binding Lrp family transcriptional regulator